MRWQGGRRSANIEDRRGMRAGRPLAVGGGAAGLVTLVLVLLFGGSPSDYVPPSGGTGGYLADDGTGGPGSNLVPQAG